MKETRLRHASGWKTIRGSIPTVVITAATSAAATAATGVVATTAPASPTSAATAGSGLPRPGFVDRQATAVVFLLIEGVDRRPCFVVGAHLDEPEALAPTCVAVGDDLRALYTAELRKQLFQVGTAHPVSEVADIQFLTHRQSPET
jgi:hypothetical protein